MFKSSKTMRLVVGVATVVVVVLVVYIIVFLQIRSTNKSISTYTNEIDLVQQKEIKLRSIKNIIKESETNRAKIDVYFVGEDAVVDFIETIENLEKLSDTTIDITAVSIDDASAVESGVGELLRLNFDAIGTWENLFHLLSMIESLPFKVTLVHVGFENTSYIKTSTAVDSGDDTTEEKEVSIWKGVFGLTVLKLK